jgi:hypothetical protein
LTKIGCMNLAKSSFIAAPLFLALYGIVRLVGKADGAYGPGWDWQLAHVAAVVGMLLFVPVVVQLGSLLRPSWWRGTLVGVSLAGLVAAIVQFGADIVIGLQAADKAEMGSLSDRFSAVPGVEVAVYAVGPQLFFVGLTLLAIAAAAARKLPWWSALLVVIGVALPPVSLNLLPVAGLCLAAAFFPLRAGAQLAAGAVRQS